jgi:hypothetical protein
MVRCPVKNVLLVGSFACALIGGSSRDTGAQGFPDKAATARGLHGTRVVNQVSQYGVTWVFDRPATVGTFANGDFWVLGPLAIVRIDPAFDGRHNGWQINPQYSGAQGFDIRAKPFDTSVVPRLPYRVSGNQSIVQVISLDTANAEASPVLQSAAVLTVVMSIPPDGGLSVFRPPYAGAAKPMYPLGSLHTNLLPALAPVAGAPPLDTVYAWFRRVQLDIKGGLAGELLRPVDNIRGLGYAPSMAMYSNDAALRLMLNAPLHAKMPALIA